MRQYTLSQTYRAALLLVDIALLFGVNLLAFGRIVPTLDTRGMWFFAALLNILLGSSLLTPFFVKPVDAIAYATPAMLALLFAQQWHEWTEIARFIYAANIALASFVLIMAFMSIITKDAKGTRLQSLSNGARILLDAVGRPEILYTGVFFFTVSAFHAQLKEVLLLCIAWAAVPLLRPAQRAADVLRKIRVSLSRVGPIVDVGTVVAYQQPGIVLLRQSREIDCPFLTPLLLNDSVAGARIALTLDHVGRSEGLLLRAVVLAEQPSQIACHACSSVPADTASRASSIELGQMLTKKQAEHDYAGLMGLVSADTTVETLQFEVIRDENLQEGRLVTTPISGKRVMYQVLDGLTREEIVERKNTFGYVRARARKIGMWDSQHARFEPVPWLPRINSPVYLDKPEQCIPPVSVIGVGHFPDTNYQVFVEDLHSLVTHNTAILGILGVGKSMLAIELVERIMQASIKVICLDLTSQYATELSVYYDPTYEEMRLASIADAGSRDREAWAENPAQGGSIPNFRNAVLEDLRDFLDGENSRMLKIYNPARLFATRQLSEPRSFQVGGNWHRGASLYDITPVEATQVISECALELLSVAMCDRARVCIVYEEAHSLVPEWNSVVAEGDKAATCGTARAILQGRKYGLGCLLVTQRTANVTKTILNQCNSVFAMRSFDQTGMEFLANYIGKDYSAVLSSLPDRHAVYFGRSSSCKNPVLLRLNDHEHFLSVFRTANPPPALPPARGSAPDELVASDGHSEGDIPF